MLDIKRGDKVGILPPGGSKAFTAVVTLVEPDAFVARPGGRAGVWWRTSLQLSPWMAFCRTTLRNRNGLYTLGEYVVVSVNGEELRNDR